MEIYIHYIYINIYIYIYIYIKRERESERARQGLLKYILILILILILRGVPVLLFDGRNLFLGVLLAFMSYYGGRNKIAECTGLEGSSGFVSVLLIPAPLMVLASA